MQEPLQPAWAACGKILAMTSSCPLMDCLRWARPLTALAPSLAAVACFFTPTPSAHWSWETFFLSLAPSLPPLSPLPCESVHPFFSYAGQHGQHEQLARGRADLAVWWSGMPAAVVCSARVKIFILYTHVLWAARCAGHSRQHGHGHRDQHKHKLSAAGRKWQHLHAPSNFQPQRQREQRQRQQH